jgi:hypothetical protein
MGLPLSDLPVFEFRRCCFRHAVFLSKESPAVDAWNSPEWSTLRPGIQIRSNRRRFFGYAALDDSDNYGRQYDEVKECRHWYQEKPNCVHVSTSCSIFGRLAFTVKLFNASAKIINAKAKKARRPT